MFAACCLIASAPALAQSRPVPASDQDDQDQQVQPLPSLPSAPTQAGRVATSAVGEVGQRQAGSVQPMARIASRIQNRVESRLRNRIDRDYDPQANAADPFVAAEDQVRAAGRPR